MAFERRPVAASQQILDQGLGATTAITNGTFGQVTAAGAKWPLMPNTVCRVYNASVSGLPANNGKLQIVAMSVVAVLLDASLNSLNVENIILGAWNATGGGSATPLTMGPDGAALAVSGDPLIELVSGIFVAGVAQTLAGVAGLQIQAFADVFNTDSGSQNFTLTLAALLSFVPRKQNG